MKPSPLQLERHFFTKVQVVAHPDGDACPQGELFAEVDVARDADDPKRYQLTLRFKLLPSPDMKPRYTAEIHVVGLVRVAESWPEDKIPQLVEANGAALLYSAAREMLCNLTARGPWPMICLHSANIVESKPPVSFKPSTADLPVNH